MAGQRNAIQKIGRVKEMAIFGLRKAFVDPAPKPVKMNSRMSGFFGNDVSSGNWLPE